MLATAGGYGGTASYTYDGDANLTGRTDASGAATFGYDNAGRTTSTIDPLTATTATNTYDPAGRLATVTHGSGKSSREYSYDTLGRIATDTTRKPDTTVAASISYGYDNDSLLTSKTTVGLTGAGANTYTYDGLGRVTSWLNPGGTTTSYGYDPASNRTTVTTSAGTRTSTFDERNRLTGTTGASLPADSYTWTPRGTLATANTTTYTFDAFERLTQAQKIPGYTVTFTYDSLDRPAQRGAANFGYNNLTNNAVLSPTAAGEAKLLREPDGDPLSTKTGAATGTLLVDDQLHGDVAATTDVTTGVPSASANYDPWGGTTSAVGTLPLGYQGGWTDYQTALVNAHARWYNPATGGFTSRDTSTLRPHPVTQTNRYLYANGSPLGLSDPRGHEPGSWCEHWSCAVLNTQSQTSHPMESASVNGVVQKRSALKIDSDVYASAYVIENHLACQERIYGPEARLSQIQNDDGVCRISNDLTSLVFGAIETLYDVATNEASGLGYMPNLICYTCVRKEQQNKQAMAEIKAIVYAVVVEDYEKCFTTLDPQSCLWVAFDISTLMFGGVLIKPIKLMDDLPDAIKAADKASDAAKAAAVGEQGADAGRHIDDLQKLPGARCSFAADTPVLMADGATRPIADIVPGDEVAATDPVAGTTQAATVTATWNHEDTLIRLNTSVGSVTTTEDHPFWDATSRTWEQAQDLGRNDSLGSLYSASATAQGLDWTTTRTDAAFNLTVADIHTYYVVVGSTPVLVHNAGCDEWAAAFAEKNGGEIKRFTGPDGEDFPLGEYRPGGPGTAALDETWFHHTVVVKDGKVFDQWHPQGMRIDEYKNSFDYRDYIDFGF